MARPPLTLFAVILAACLAYAAGMGTGSREALTLGTACADPRGCSQQKSMWASVRAQADWAFSQAEAGTIMVWQSVVSSARRRVWLPWKLEKPQKQQTQDASMLMVSHGKLTSNKTSREADGSWVRTIVGWCCVAVAVLIYCACFGRIAWVLQNPHPRGTPRASVDHDEEVPPEEEPTKERHAERHHSVAGVWTTEDTIAMGTDELVDHCGVSAMCIIEANQLTGVARLKNKHAVLLLALQSFLLQGGMLFYMLLQLVPREMASADEHPLPHCIVFIAIYLHFINCVQEVPYTVQLFRHLGDFHSNLPDLFTMAGVLITDGFVVPTLAFLLGSLYICVSRTIGDVILNAVAVAFVREIDNWILALDARTNKLGGRVEDKMVHMPIDHTMMKRISYIALFVPVLPAAMTWSMCWLGFSVLKL